MHNWELIRAFLALHRAATFEGAAQVLGVDHSTLRRRIQHLEQDVGEALFMRRDGCYFILPSVRPLLEAAMRMEASSRAFYEGASSGDRGAIRVSMMDVFAAWLAPDLAKFRILHPEIQLDIGTEHYFVDLEKEMVDVALRLARPTRGASRLRKLAEIAYGVYASPYYLAARSKGAGEAEHDLLALSIHFLHGDHDFLAGETAWALEHLPAGRIVCAADSYLALRRLCEAGMGLALLPEILGDASDRLVRFSHQQRPSCDLWLVTHSDTSATRRVRLFVEHLNQVFRQRLNPRDARELSIVDDRSERGLAAG